MVAATLVADPAAVSVAGRAVPIGCPVRDVAGAEVGRLAAADADCLVVAPWLPFRTYLVPLAAVAAFDGGALRLRVSREVVRRGAWDEGCGSEGRPRW